MIAAPFVTLVLAGSSIAQPSPGQPIEGREGPAEPGFLEWERATGDWWGARGALEEQGLSFAASNVFEWTSVWSGGLVNRAASRNLFTADLTFDLEKMVGLDGATFFAQYLSVTPDRGASEFAGDIQGFSNIENPYHLDALYEIWWEQRLLDDRLRFKIGKFDANSEFAYIDIAADFANSSAGFSPTISGFPSYPASAFGVAAFFKATEQLTLSYAFLDGAFGVDEVPTGNRGLSSFFSDEDSNDYFHVAEAAIEWSRIGDFGEGRFALGASYHTGEFERFDGGTQSGAVSFYVTMSQRLTGPRVRPDPENPGPGLPAIRPIAEDDRGLYVFAQYGLADEDISDFAQHIAAGLVLVGPFDRRQDRTGVYFTYADLSDEPDAGFPRDEYVVDGYYRLAVTDFAWIQPELQVIVNPSGDPDIDPAVVGGIRFGVDF